MPVHKPAPLPPGGRIAVVAPAGCVEESDLQIGIAAIRAQGFAVEWQPNLLARKGYLGGDESARARALIEYFQRDDVDAIFCARGGFGSAQLLPILACEKRLPAKIFTGYSDITMLLNWLLQYRHMVTFHAPMVATDLARGVVGRTKEQFWGTVTGSVRHWEIRFGPALRPGATVGELVGGCLSLLVTTLGTPYEIDTRGKILFLEDVGEKPYRIERMLTHLKLAGKLRQLAGVIFGDFTNCEGDGSRNLAQIFGEIFHDAPYPVVMGLAAGHGAENLTLPLGVKMGLDVNGSEAALRLMESPVT